LYYTFIRDPHSLTVLIKADRTILHYGEGEFAALDERLAVFKYVLK